MDEATFTKNRKHQTIQPPKQHVGTMHQHIMLTKRKLVVPHAQNTYTLAEVNDTRHWHILLQTQNQERRKYIENGYELVRSRNQTIKNSLHRI